MTKWTWLALGMVVGSLGSGVGMPRSLAPEAVEARSTAAPAVEAQTGKVFELRTYTANPGKFEAMQARFRQHILPLFKKHNLTLVGFWTYADPPASENTLVYILSHESREAAKKNWAAFMADPVRVKVWADTEKDGPINLKVDSVFLNPFDASPIK